MLLLYSRGDELVKPDCEVSDFFVAWPRLFGLGNVEENEVVVVGEAHHELRRRERSVAEEIAHCLRRRLEDVVQLFPAVDLLDLLVSVEVEIEDYKLAALLNRLAQHFERSRNGWDLLLRRAKELPVARQSQLVGASRAAFRSTTFTSAASSNGFSTKSSAPVSSACRLFIQSWRAVTMMTRMDEPSVG